MVRLTIPAQHVFRDLVVSAVLAAIDAEGGSPDADARDEIVSALGEAFNNVVLHAYGDVRGGMVDVRVTATPSSVEVAVSDRGRSFDPAAVPSYAAPQMDGDGALDDVDLDQLPEGGMGLFIMRSFMDEVTYVAGGDGRPNVLVLRKTWPAGRPAKRPVNQPAREAPPGASASKKESSQSGWRMRSVAVPSYEQSTAGSLKRK